MNLARGSAAVCFAAIAAASVHAELTTATAPLLNPTRAVSASARLDFAVTLGSFLSLQVGSPGSTIDTVGFDLTSLAPPTCTATPLPICFGNGTPVNATTNPSLAVTVKSNGGKVNLQAKVVTALTSGANNTIPMSQIVLTSSDAARLPAPLLPDTNPGASVNVTPTDFSGKVTVQSANWSFAYANTVSPAAGTYNGQVMFIATAP
jgi:hypothetical protein